MSDEHDDRYDGLERDALCLSCMGEGHDDTRDSDAIVEEHVPPHIVDSIRRWRGDTWKAIIVCDRCGGTGRISQREHDDLMAAGRAYVDQIIARAEAEDRAPNVQIEGPS